MPVIRENVIPSLQRRVARELAPRVVPLRVWVDDFKGAVMPQAKMLDQLPGRRPLATDLDTATRMMMSLTNRDFDPFAGHLSLRVLG